MKKIAIISEKFSCGGLETRIASLAKSLKKRGVEVFLIVGKDQDTSLVDFVVEKNNIYSTDMSISSLSVTKNIFSLVEILQKINPDVIDLQPFSSLIYGGIASGILSKPFFITLHGSTNIYMGNDFNPTYAKFLEIISLYANKLIVISKKCKEELIQFLGSSVATNKIQIITNSVNVEEFKYSFNPNGPAIIVSRLNSDKEKGIINFVEFLAQNNFNRGIEIYGEGQSRKFLVSYFKKKKINQVVFKGKTTNTAMVLRQGYCVASGVGRSAIESCVSAIPTMIFSVDGTLRCFADIGNIQKLSNANFTALDVAEDYSSLKKKIKDLKSLDTTKIREWMIKRYNQEENTSKYLKLIDTNKHSHNNWYKKALFAYETTNDSIFGFRALFWLKHSFPDVTDNINQLQQLQIQRIIEKINLDINKTQRENSVLRHQLKIKEEELNNINNSLSQQIVKNFQDILNKLKN